MSTMNLDQRITELVAYMKDLKKKDPEECEKTMDLMADYHIEANELEAEFWQKFLLAWKRDMS